MDVSFTAPVWYWRGPSPFYFVTVPEPGRTMIASAAELVPYGWGMVPVVARIGGTEWSTSLFPKDGGYIVPLRDSVRKAEGIELDATVSVVLTVDV